MHCILHLIDDATADDSLVTLRQLIRRLPRPEYRHILGVVGRTAIPAWAEGAAGVLRFGGRLGWVPTTALPVRAAIRDCGAQIVHAWSDTTAAVAQFAASGDCRVVVTVGTPPARRAWSKWWAAFGGLPSSPAPAIVCPSRLFFRRAIEAGIPTIRCGVIRPAVDFSAINEARRTMERAALGISEGAPVLLTPSPPSRPGGHYCAVWAAAVLQQIWPGLRIILPGESMECRRLRRFAASFRQPDLLITPGRRFELEQLLVLADLMVVPAIGDVPTGAVAWAMAAGVPVVGSAVPSVAEYIADHQNGLLCKPGKPMVLASRIRAAMGDIALMRRLTETARAQAFEVFGLTRLVDQYRALYENVLHGRHAFEGVTDAAFVA